MGERLTRIEALQRMLDADEEYDACPECGEAFEDVDMTGAGDLYFVHDEDESTVDGCTHTLEEVESVDF